MKPISTLLSLAAFVCRRFSVAGFARGGDATSSTHHASLPTRLGLAWLMVVFLLAPAAQGAIFEFSNAGGTTINDNANATPYPSTITVSGVSGPVSGVRVKLNGFTHTFPDDVDVFLVAPGGQVCAVLSDAGASGYVYVNLVFDDTAATAIPDSTQITSGTYRPANYEAGEPLPPGGTGSIGTNLTALAAGGVNGDWKLFVSDDAGSDFGSITSWAVVIETGTELAIQMYAGLNINGTVGIVYQIQYVTDLAQTNNASAWRCLEFLQLPGSPYLQLPASAYLWPDKSAPATGRRFYRAVEFAAPANMVFIPPGTFRMGSPLNEENRWGDEDPQTAVTISRGYWIGQYEVTQGEYQAVKGSNPSFFTGDPNRPVETVTWFDATNYCATLTQRERAAGRIATNSVYRLPTEAEWEYACRGWTSSRFSYGEDPDHTRLRYYAWYSLYSGGSTHQVGQLQPNPWSLYDMHGNVREWCQDWYDYYPGGFSVDPQGPATGSSRVIRGGSWRDTYYLNVCRSASRRYEADLGYRNDLGFRVVLAPSQP